MNNVKTPQPPLRGLRVLDCSSGTAGPRSTGILADYGADVIWVEPPGGDHNREALALEYSVFNRGKRSITLDLKTEAGQARLYELAGESDVLFHSFGPGTADRLGIGWEEIHRRFPALVYSHITGFGEDCELADIPGYETLVHAWVGTMAEQAGHREGPIFEALPFASIGAAYLSVIGTLAAVYRGMEDHCGRKVETSLYDGAVSFMMTWGTRDDVETPAKAVLGNRRSIIRNFECGDGKYVAVHTGAVGAFARAAKVLGIDDRIVLRDDGLDMREFSTPDEFELLTNGVPEIFLTQDRSYWVDALLKADVAVMPALDPGEVYDEPQTIHNKVIVKLDDPVLGPIEQIGIGIEFSATPGRITGPAPTIGDDDQISFNRNSPNGTSSEDSDRWLTAASDGKQMEPDMGPLLADVKILDLGVYYAGPFSSRLLADLGADVIKLETLAGDPLRGRDHIFNSGQAGKRAISVDLKTEKGRAISDSLIEWADIMHHNMRPGAAERAGVGADHATSLNPDLVYLHAPGWGGTGPFKDRQSFAPLLSAYVGIGAEVAGQFNPTLFPVGNEDTGNGFLGAFAMLASLLHRRRKDEGQFIMNPQLNAALLHTSHMVRKQDGQMLGAGRLDPLQFGISAFDRLYETSDGWLCLTAKNVGHIAGIERALTCKLPDSAQLLTANEPSNTDYDISDIIREALYGHTSEAALALLLEQGVPAALPVGPNNFSFMHNSQNIDRRLVAITSDTDGIAIRDIDLLMRITDVNLPVHRLSPRLGEHTSQVLTQLGYSDADITGLRDTKVVA